jgi:hypothetical protein
VARLDGLLGTPAGNGSAREAVADRA